MTRRPLPLHLLLPALALGALALGIPAASLASEPTTTASSPPAEGTSTSPAPESPATSTAASEPAPAESTPAGEPPPPRVQAEHAQGASPSGSHATGRTHRKSSARKTPGVREALGPRARRRTPGVGGLRSRTPSLPLDLRSSIAGVPSFFIESFQIPPFLLPIFQAAGTAYGIPWQVLAAINEVETDYGRDLSLSSAGAEGWMQFLPSEWAQYGVDANGDGWKDPYNPADAIFAAARYLRAAGGETDIRAAVFSYNHSQAYVESVLLRAQLLDGTPPGTARRDHRPDRGPLPGARPLALQRRLPDGHSGRLGDADDAGRHDDLLAGGRPGDRRRGR
jgi:soluble lytic murein transglycosylase-like protein